MALKVLPGARATFIAVVNDPDTLERLQGVPLYLDRLDQPTAPPEQVAGAESDASGEAVFAITLPTVPGSYRYRARSPGVPDKFRSDTSGAVVIEVVA